MRTVLHEIHKKATKGRECNVFLREECLGARAELRKTTISFDISECLSAHPYLCRVQLDSHSTYFHNP
jgi:hypothetical protein